MARLCILAPCHSTLHLGGCGVVEIRSSRLDVANLSNKVIKLLLGIGIFLCHLLVLGLPLVSCCFQSLDFTLVVTSLDIGLTEPTTILVCYREVYDWMTDFSLVSLSCLSFSSASSSSS